MSDVVWNDTIQRILSDQLLDTSSPNEEWDNTGQRLLWTPTSDTEAARSFLKVKRGSVATHRRYSREIFRFFLWMHHVDTVSLISITPTHVEDYLKFCISPPPSWCGNPGGSTLITSPQWRPFKEKNQPSVNSIQNTLAIIKSFFAYLRNVGYLNGDPTRVLDGSFRAAVMAAAAARSTHTESAYSCRPGKEPEGLTITQWRCLWETLETLPRHTPAQIMKQERALYVMSVLYYTAARSEEARSHTQKAFRYDPNRDCWTITFYGKGAKKRVLPVHTSLLDAVQRFRQFHGFSSTPQQDAIPLFPNYRIFNHNRSTLRSAMSERGAEVWIKSIFRRTQARLKMYYPEELHKCPIQFEDATLHTIRHTRARHMLFIEGVDIRLVQAFLGHSKILTTQGYTEPSIDELIRAVSA
ncbi:MAG: site-specific integrase [Myxococcales bacterium]|nr:site-specific integrase [Myxococcales bacterium]